MARESCKGTKELMPLYISKDIIALLRAEATREKRNMSAQVEFILSAHLQPKGTKP